MLQPKKKMAVVPVSGIDFSEQLSRKTPPGSKNLPVIGSFIKKEQVNQATDRKQLHATGRIDNPQSYQAQQNAKKIVQPLLKQETRSKEEMGRVSKSVTAAKADAKHGAKPLIYLDNPDKLLGDAFGAIAPNNKFGFPTSKAEREDLAYNTHNPYKSPSEKLNYSFKKGVDHVPGALANLLMAGEGAGMSGALKTMNNAVNPLAGSGGSIKRLTESARRTYHGLMTPTRTKQLIAKVGENTAIGLTKDEGKEKVLDGVNNKFGWDTKRIKSLFGIKDAEEVMQNKFKDVMNKSNVSLETPLNEFNKQKQQSLDFWKTPEGRRRIEHNLKENGSQESADDYIQRMSEIGYLKPSSTTMIRKDADNAFFEQSDLNKEKVSLKDKLRRGIITQVEHDHYRQNVIDVKEQEVFNKIGMKQLVPENNAYYATWRDKNEKLFVGEDYSVPANLKSTVNHEWAHAKDIEMVHGGENIRNKKLIEGLDLNENVPKHLIYKDNFKSFGDSMNGQNTSKEGMRAISKQTGRDSYHKGAKDYFLNGNNDGASKEPTAFLSEVRQHLLDTGSIKELGDDITEDMLKNSMSKYRSNKGMKPILRLFDITNPTKKSLGTMRSFLNNMEAVIPITGAATTASTIYAVNKKGQGSNKKS